MDDAILVGILIDSFSIQKYNTSNTLLKARYMNLSAEGKEKEKRQFCHAYRHRLVILSMKIRGVVSLRSNCKHPHVRVPQAHHETDAFAKMTKISERGEYFMFHGTRASGNSSGRFAAHRHK